MSEITTAFDVATILFTAVAGLAVLVTGFFVGRYWFRLTSDPDKDPSESWEAYGKRRAKQDNYD